MKMKRLAAVFMAFALTATLLTGCGDNATGEANNNGESVVETQESKVHEELVSFVEENRASIDQINEAMGDSMDISVEVDDETLVFLFKMNMEVPEESLEAVKDALVQQEETMKTQFDALKTALDAEVEGATMVLRYEDSAGTELGSMTIE